MLFYGTYRFKMIEFCHLSCAFEFLCCETFLLHYRRKLLARLRACLQWFPSKFDEIGINKMAGRVTSRHLFWSHKSQDTTFEDWMLDGNNMVKQRSCWIQNWDVLVLSQFAICNFIIENALCSITPPLCWQLQNSDSWPSYIGHNYFGTCWRLRLNVSLIGFSLLCLTSDMNTFLTGYASHVMKLDYTHIAYHVLDDIMH